MDKPIKIKNFLYNKTKNSKSENEPEALQFFQFPALKDLL